MTHQQLLHRLLKGVGLQRLQHVQQQRLVKVLALIHRHVEQPLLDRQQVEQFTLWQGQLRGDRARRRRVDYRQQFGDGRLAHQVAQADLPLQLRMVTGP
ncbi:hypothetical protein D3C81_2142700 [compost metagenome]